MFPLFWGGFYRILPSDSFPWELSFGYAMELFIGLIPSLFFMIQTNSATDDALIATQSAAIIVKVFSLLIFIFELILMVCEIYTIRKLQKDEISGYKKLTEEERRHQPTAFMLGIFSLFVIVIVMIGGLAGIPERNCDTLGRPATLEMATCQPCVVNNCIDCSTGSTTCAQCARNYTVFEGDFGHECVSCNANCFKCSHNGKKARCAEDGCESGYRW